MSESKKVAEIKNYACMATNGKQQKFQHGNVIRSASDSKRNLDGKSTENSNSDFVSEGKIKTYLFFLRRALPYLVIFW